MNDFDSWAEYYDIIYQSKQQNPEDYEYYADLVDDADKALEVACGTGRLYLQMLDEGHNVHGLDISEAMLARLRQKAADDTSPTVVQADVTASDLDLGTTYDCIYYPFSAILHLQGIDKQRAAITNIYDHLTDEGVFALDVPVPDFERVARYGNLSQEEVVYDGTTYLVEFWEELTDRTKQEHEMHQRVINTETETIEFETVFDLTLLPKEQLELLLIEAGFDEYTFYDGFSDTPIQPNTDRMVVTARR